METEYWVLSIIAIVLALVAGFIGGRMSAPRQRRVEAMEQERDAAREEAEAVRAEVNRHFEESARMFGKLASDYRTFFQQFAQTAQNLGLSEGRARELLEEADPNLVARRAGRSDGAASEATKAGEDTGADEAATGATQTPADVGTDPASAETVASGDTSTSTATSGADVGEGEARAETAPGDEVPPDYVPERDRRE